MYLTGMVIVDMPEKCEKLIKNTYQVRVDFNLDLFGHVRFNSKPRIKNKLNVVKVFVS